METPAGLEQMPALSPVAVKSGMGFMVCGLKNGSQGLGLTHAQPTTGAPKTVASQAINRSQGLGFGDLGSSELELLGGPDQTRRSNLLHAHPQSPTTAFNSLSFRSPPLGPQPFSRQNTKPLPNPDAKEGNPLKPLATSAPWDFWYKKEGSVLEGLGVSSKEGYGQDSGVSSEGVYGQGLGVSGLGSDGPTGTLVRVRQLEWADELEMLEKVGGGSADVQPSLEQVRFPSGSVCHRQSFAPSTLSKTTSDFFGDETRRKFHHVSEKLTEGRR